MSKHSFIKDGLTIVFHYYPAEAPNCNLDSWACGPGSPADLDIEAILLKDLSGKKDLYIALQGDAWWALVDWAKAEAWEYMKRQVGLSAGDPD